MRAVLTVGGLGRLRPGPGTWASAAATVAGLGLWQVAGFPGLLLATLLVTLLGLWACGQHLLPDEDPDEVVIDEVAGQWLALCLPAAAFFGIGWQGALPWPAWVGAFLLFRLFDIWKPGPVGWADRRGGAPGVMGDDLIAGAMAGLGVLILGAAWHAVLILTR